MSGEYEKLGTNTDSVSIEKKRIFDAKSVKEFINKLPKQVFVTTFVTPRNRIIRHNQHNQRNVKQRK